MKGRPVIIAGRPEGSFALAAASVAESATTTEVVIATPEAATHKGARRNKAGTERRYVSAPRPEPGRPNAVRAVEAIRPKIAWARVGRPVNHRRWRIVAPTETRPHTDPE